MNITEITYIAQARQPNGEWLNWKSCATFAEAENVIAEKRAELSEQQDRKTPFRIIRHEVIHSDATGDIVLDTCKEGHKFVRLPTHPIRYTNYCCPKCLLIELEEAYKEGDKHRIDAENTKAYLAHLEVKTSRLVNMACSFHRSADKTVAANAIAEYEKFIKEYSS